MFEDSKEFRVSRFGKTLNPVHVEGNGLEQAPTISLQCGILYLPENKSLSCPVARWGACKCICLFICLFICICLFTFRNVCRKLLNGCTV